MSRIVLVRVGILTDSTGDTVVLGGLADQVTVEELQAECLGCVDETFGKDGIRFTSATLQIGTARPGETLRPSQ